VLLQGLLFGVYTDISGHSCGPGPGSLGHYELDAQTFAHDFHVDYLKVDFCGPWSGASMKPFNHSCIQGGLTAGGDLKRENTTVAAGLAWCAANTHCAGFSSKAPSNSTCGDDQKVLDIYFSTHMDVYPNGDAAWSNWLKPDAARVSIQPGPQYEAWQQLSQALNATGRAIYFSICPHTLIPFGAAGFSKEWQGTLAYSPPPAWTAKQRKVVANSVLVEYTNTWDSWYVSKEGAVAGEAHGGIITAIDSMITLTKLAYSGPGSWNDADMLQLCTYGKGRTPGNGMTLTEYRAQYSVFAILASPLIISADIRTIATDHPDCLQLMLNPEIVDVNQNDAGHAPWLVSQTTNSSEVSSSSIVSQVFARPLGTTSIADIGAEIAVLLLNRAEEPATLSVSWEELGIPTSQTMAVRDVTGRNDLPAATGHFIAVVAKHDVAFIRLTHVR
jgi:hypothetical protein